MGWSLNVGAVDTSVSGQITYESENQINGLPMLVRLFGTGLTVDGSGVPTAGTFTSMQLIDQSTGPAGTVVQTVTMTGGFSAASFGALITDATDISSQIQTWGYEGIEQEAVFTPTSITLFGANGETLVITGSGFIGTSYQGTITSIQHLDAGSSVLNEITGLSTSAYAGALSLGGTDAAYAFLVQGNDTIVENASGYSFIGLDGGLGDDTITALPGSSTRLDFSTDAVGAVVVDLSTNSVSGGAGSDTLSNISSVSGTQLADALTGNASDNTLSGNAGNDTLAGGGGNDQLFGEDGDDSLAGGADNDFLAGNSGDDTLSGGTGFNVLEGGGGNDIFVFARDGGTNEVRDFGARTFFADLRGENVLPSGIASTAEGFASLVLDRSQSAAHITVNVFNLDIDSLQTGPTADDVTELHLRRGSSTVTGPNVFGIIGPDNDQDGDTQINGSGPFGQATTAWDGNEGASTTLSAEIANLTAGNLYAHVATSANPGGELRGQFIENGTGSADRIDVTALNIGSLAALMAIAGGSPSQAVLETTYDGVVSTMLLNQIDFTSLTAADFIFTTSTASEVFTGTGNDDDLFGAAGNDTLQGSDGDDRLYGEVGADLLDGGFGNETLEGGLGNDTIDGGDGSDIALYVNATGAVQVYLNLGYSQGAEGRDTLISIETVVGSAHDDRLVGDANANVLDGFDGADIIKGKGGADLYFGGAGDDKIIGDAGNDTMFGGDGNDYFSALGGLDELFGEAGNDTLNGGQDNDLLEGGADADKLRGNLGNDTMLGGSGNDSLWGGGSNDSLDGGDGADFLTGENNKDTLAGGLGDDVLTGGAGAATFDGFEDTFVFAAGWGFDRVNDFENGIDRIDLTAFNFTDFVTDVAPLISAAGAGGIHSRLDFGGGDTLYLQNTLSTALDASDFLL